MSRAAKATLLGSIVATVSIVWGVHFLQREERNTMYKGVQRDEVRQQERLQRLADLEKQRERERDLRAIQPIDPNDKSISNTHQI
ncbi:hypothetical protein MPSI1_002898 [Malassezia psittaci]|uniref:Cytochrome c oxidase assembly protein n=1 Tax=Malassezia psittaci TaxID=1821823 RepID=A0AAF0JEN7_9BASI|nr:hypothetical protein MPSI1_002898 [Malassezia psittaci]